MTHSSLIFALCLVTYSIYPTEYAYGQHTSPLAAALIVGTDINGKSLFLCRATLEGGMQIGITSVGTNQCTIIYEGAIHILTQYTIPSQLEFGHYIWSTNNERAITVGHDTKGRPLFLCQAEVNGHLLPGATRPGYNYCTVVYQGKAVITAIKNILSLM